MPTIKRFSRSRIEMRPVDHPPPHFHIVTQRKSISVRLDDFTITGIADPRDTREAIAWARKHRNKLETQWKKYSPMVRWRHEK